MASTITVPTTANLGGFATEVATNLATKGDFDARVANALITLATEATTDINALQAGTTITGIPAASMPGFARGVCTSNMSTSAFVGVTGGTAQDGVTYVAGEVVLFAGQTATAENGPWVVGTVAAGTAPLTRPAWWAAGSTILNGFVINVSEGTIWRGSSWKAMCTGTKVVGTTNHDPLLYPRTWMKTVTLSSGTYTAGAGGGSEPVYLFSTTTSSVQATRNTAGGTLTNTTHYFCPVASRVAGKAGTGAVVVTASVAAGTVNTADTSTVDLLVVNW